MTKDLAIAVHNDINVSRNKYVNTEEFILKVASFLKNNLNG